MTSKGVETHRLRTTALEVLYTCQEGDRTSCWYDTGPSRWQGCGTPFLSVLNKGHLVTATGHNIEIAFSVQNKGTHLIRFGREGGVVRAGTTRHSRMDGRSSLQGT